MPEGLLQAGGTITAGVHDDPDHEPEPTADAPRGWAWQRKDRKWAPRQRGPIKWAGDGDAMPGSAVPGHAGRPAADSDDPGRAASADRDPDPSWLRDGKQAASKLRIEDVPRQVVGDMAGLMGLVGAPILAVLQSADPYCGGALARSYEGIVDAVLPLVCRSEKIISYFTGDKADWLLWGKLAMALAPIARAIVEHHVVRSVRVVRDPQTGEATVIRRADDEPEHGDHLVPPLPDLSYQA